MALDERPQCLFAVHSSADIAGNTVSCDPHAALPMLAGTRNWRYSGLGPSLALAPLGVGLGEGAI